MMKPILRSIVLLSSISFFAQKTEPKIPVLIPKNIEGKFGYVNQTGKVIIKPEYKIAMFFSEDCNLLNSTNAVAKKYGSKNYATVEKNGFLFRINKFGKRLYMVKDKDLGACKNEFVHQPYWAYRYAGKYGIVNKEKVNPEIKEDFIIYPDYQLLHIMEGKDLNNPMIVAVKNNKFGVIDKANNIVVPFVYDDIKRNFSWKIAQLFEVTKDGKDYYFVDTNNKAY